MNKYPGNTVKRAGPNHFRHAVVLLLLWVPIAVIEVILFKDVGGITGMLAAAEERLLLFGVVAASICLLALAIWKFTLHLKQKNTGR